MIEARGDIWKYLVDHPEIEGVAVLTNTTVNTAGNLIMGKGNARQAAELFPQLPGEWGQWYRNPHHQKYNTVIGTRCRMPGSDKLFGQPGNDSVNANRLVWAFSYPTKNDWRDPAITGLIIDGAHQLMQFAATLNIQVILPRPGCGLGGFDWEKQVKPMISPILDDNFTVISF